MYNRSIAKEKTQAKIIRFSTRNVCKNTTQKDRQCRRWFTHSRFAQNKYVRKSLFSVVCKRMIKNECIYILCLHSRANRSKDTIIYECSRTCIDTIIYECNHTCISVGVGLRKSTHL